MSAITTTVTTTGIVAAGSAAPVLAPAIGATFLYGYGYLALGGLATIATGGLAGAVALGLGAGSLIGAGVLGAEIDSSEDLLVMGNFHTLDSIEI
jgi:hypothetical protein